MYFNFRLVTFKMFNWKFVLISYFVTRVANYRPRLSDDRSTMDFDFFVGEKREENGTTDVVNNKE